MFPATLFDYNGVLVDDEAVHMRAFREALAPLGVTFSDRAYWDVYIGFDDREGFEAMLRDAGAEVSEQRITELVRRKQPIYMRMAATELVPFSGARDLIRRRAATGPAAIVSGALRPEIELGLRMLGADDAICGIVAAEDTERSKPHPEGYLLGREHLERTGLPSTAAQRALVIEDSAAGVTAAVAAELPVVGVTHTSPGSALTAAGAALVVASLDELSDARLGALYLELYGD